jgi:hypothetical protein
MNASGSASSAGTPWHVWLVGVLSLLWNGVGAFDYTMTQTRDASYMSAFTAEQLAYFYGFPRWVIATWALSVWGGVAGSLLLLLRRRQAVLAFGVSLIAMAPTFFHNYVLTNGLEVMGGAGGLVFTAVIVGVGIGLLVHSRRLASRGALR